MSDVGLGAEVDGVLVGLGDGVGVGLGVGVGVGLGVGVGVGCVTGAAGFWLFGFGDEFRCGAGVLEACDACAPDTWEECDPCEE